MGDFNVDSLSERRSAQINYAFVKDICSTFTLINLVKEYTRIDKRNGSYVPSSKLLNTRVKHAKFLLPLPAKHPSKPLLMSIQIKN